MFTLLCKFFHWLQQKPGWLFSAACLLTVLAFIPLKDFEVRAAASDLLPPEWESVKAWKSFGQKFGSAGNLAVVAHSPNPKRNLKAIENLARRLKSHPDVNFLEYKTESEFYRRHKLLYISLSDLREVERRVETGFWINRKKSNPLILDLLSGEEKDRAFDATSFEDLEAKYFSRLKDLHGSLDSTTLVLRIYPRFDVTDIHACRAFLTEVQLLVADASRPSDSLEILYAGEVFHNVHNEGRLFSKVLGTTRIALAASGLLLLLTFLRFPVGALLAVIPVGMATVWTLALSRLWLGPPGLVTSPLGLLLIGLGLCGTLHLLSRYAEERRKKISAPIAFETILLETGPAIAAGLLTLAVAFLTFLTTDFRALSDFGWIAGIGMVCNLFAVLAVFPSLLRLVEPLGWLNTKAPRLYNSMTPFTQPFRPAPLFLGAAVVLTFFLLLQGPQWRFQYDFNALGFPNTGTLRADSLLRASGEDLGNPAAFLTATSMEAEQVATELRRRSADSPGLIGEITTLRDQLPADQEEKLRITNRLRRSITPAMVREAKEPLRANLVKLMQSWPSRSLNVRDLPLNYRQKFLGRGETPGVFTYAFPARDPKEGINSLRFSNEVKSVTLSNGRTFFAGGWPVVYGDLIAHVVPDARKALIYGLLAVFLLILLTIRSWLGALVIFLPVVVTLLWMLGAMKWMHLKINPFNVVAFPIAMAYATIHALMIYHRYEEEGRGSISLVLRRTGRTALMTALIGAAGFVPMIFTGHRGLASLGVTTTLGMAFALLASVLCLPGVFGIWEARRLKRESAPVSQSI